MGGRYNTWATAPKDSTRDLLRPRYWQVNAFSVGQNDVALPATPRLYRACGRRGNDDGDGDCLRLRRDRAWERSLHVERDSRRTLLQWRRDGGFRGHQTVTRESALSELRSAYSSFAPRARGPQALPS